MVASPPKKGLNFFKTSLNFSMKMGEKVVSPAQKTKTLKRSKKHKPLVSKKLSDYLGSDSYMFAPLFSAPALNTVSSTSFELEAHEPWKKKKKLIEKIEDFLKSDCYLYAPLVTYQPWLSSSCGTVSLHEGSDTQMANSGKQCGTIHIGKNVLNTLGGELQDDNVSGSRGNVVKHVTVQRKTVEHIIHKDNNSSSAPGKLLPITEQ